nr:integrin alpha-X-like [Danio rerio]|eukprot:XP_021336139.1 integrin alpha-X-like [Danio rerio]
MSLGLSMAKDTHSSNSVVCGPTIPKDCKILTTLNGMCFQISENNEASAPIPGAVRSCPLEIDIAFLMDGSSSVEDEDFIKMKTFVITIIESFSTCNAQVFVLRISRLTLYYNGLHCSPARSEIKRGLHKKTTTIAEGVQSTGDSATMEFAQEGFSAAFTSNPQIGSYFGAEVCVVDLNSDSKTDLLLISAPTYTDSHSEGRVFVYFYSRLPYFSFSDVVLVGMAGQRGRFGSSLASPADLNGDGYRDVLVGAPLEEDGHGSIYIFNGGTDRINPTYSQRIPGSSVHSGLQYFGLSLSQSSLDHSGDTLPDIAVGSKGAVLLLRSRPMVSVVPKVTYSSSTISTSETNCSRPLENTLTVCFNMSGYKHAITDFCVDNLKVDFNFNESLNIEIGIMQEISLSVFVENRGEKSLHTQFSLKYPFGLSYRKVLPRLVRRDDAQGMWD